MDAAQHQQHTIGIRMSKTYYANTTPTSAQLAEHAQKIAAIRARKYRVYYCGQWVADSQGNSADEAINDCIARNNYFDTRRDFFKARKLW